MDLLTKKGKINYPKYKNNTQTKTKSNVILKTTKRKLLQIHIIHLTLSTKKATQLLSTFKKFFLKTKNTYDNLSDAYDVISTLFVLISTVKESIRSKKLK